MSRLLKYTGLWLLLCLSGMLPGHLQAQEVVMHEGRLLTVEKSLELAAQLERQGDKKESSRFLNIAASIHWERKNYDEAVRLYRQSLEMNQAIGNTNGMTMIHNNLGMICADMRAYDQALFHFEQTLEARRAAKQKLSMVAALVNMSVVLNNLNRHTEAVQRLDEALLLATEMNDAKQMRSCYGMLAETHEKTGNQAKTLEYFNLYRTFHELEQRTKERDYTQQAQQARLSAQLADAARRNQALEMAVNQRQLTENHQQISAFGQAVQKLMDSATKQELALSVLKHENQAKGWQLERKQREAMRQRELMAREYQLRMFTISALAVTTLLMVWLAGLYVQKRRANRKIKHSNRQILLQNSEIIRQTDHISEQARQLQESNALKDKLFSIISHDMRGPVGTLKSIFSLINDRSLDPDEFYAMATKLQGSVEGLHTMMENLLHWSYSQMDGFVTRPVAFETASTINQVCELYARTAEEKNVALVADSGEIPDVYADPEQVHLIVRNLVGNALKFTPGGGEVRVRAELENGAVRVSVRDTGVGMAADKVARLFTAATHGSDRGTAGEKGTGLGLLLCKEFAERNGGRIWVESTPGHGSTFVLELPAAVPVENQAASY